jgi:hypothetical protein
MTTGTPVSADKVLDVARGAQIVQLIKDNQLVTALVCILLWQIGALASAQTYAAGVMC